MPDCCKSVFSGRGRKKKEKFKPEHLYRCCQLHYCSPTNCSAFGLSRITHLSSVSLQCQCTPTVPVPAKQLLLTPQRKQSLLTAYTHLFSTKRKSPASAGSSSSSNNHDTNQSALSRLRSRSSGMLPAALHIHRHKHPLPSSMLPAHAG